MGRQWIVSIFYLWLALGISSGAGAALSREVQVPVSEVFVPSAVEIVRGSDLGGGIWGILYTDGSGEAVFNHYNSRGDGVGQTNGGGSVTWEANYVGFGEVTGVEVCVGDLVWSRSESGTGDAALRAVVQTFVTHPDHLHHVSIDTDGGGLADETLSGTAEHPFWDQVAREWVRMGDLQPGTRLHLLKSEDNSTAQTPAYVLANQRQNAPPGDSFTTFNFEVEDFHTYFVGDSGVWVHNISESLCEEAFSLFTEIKRKLNISDTDLPGKRLDIVEDGWRVSGPEPGNGPGHVLHALQREEFTDLAAGKFGVDKLQTYNQQKAMLAGKGAGDLYDVHHIAEKWHSKKLGINLTDKQLDELTPGIALPTSPKTFGAHEANYRKTFGHDPIYHGGEFVEGSLVQKLGQIRRRFDQGLIEDGQRGLLDEIKELYSSAPYKEANMWPATRDWLKQHVSDPSIVPD